MASIVLKPQNGDKQVTLYTDSTNVSIKLEAGLQKGDSNTYNLKSCTVKIPISCFKNDTVKSVTAMWNSKIVSVSSKVDPSNYHLYDLELSIPSGSTLSEGQPVSIELGNISVTQTAGVSGNIYLDLTYGGRHGRISTFSCNTIKVVVLKKSGSTNENILLSTIACNQAKQGYDYIYPSIMQEENLIMPIANTLSFTFNWEGGNGAPDKSDSGKFLVSFDYGDGLNLAPNQLCSNALMDKGTGLSVYDWPIPDPESTYTSGKNKGNSISWKIERNQTLKSSNNGVWVLTPGVNINWQEDFRVTLDFSLVASSNSSPNPLPSNVYVQSTEITGVADIISVQTFHLKTPEPLVLSFTQASKSNTSIFHYSFFGASMGLLTWKNQNGIHPLNRNSHEPGDVIIEKAIGFPQYAKGKTTRFKLQDHSTWGLTYWGTAGPIDSSLENAQLDMYAVNTGSTTYAISDAKQPANSDFPNSLQKFEIVPSSVKNLGQASIGGKTYTLLTWRVTGLDNSAGYCTLSNAPSIELQGSMDAGNAPYYYLYEGTNINGLKLTAYEKYGAGQVKTQAIPISVTPFEFSDCVIDMCTIKNKLYMTHNDRANHIFISVSTDGATWTPWKIPSGIIYGAHKAVPSITTDGKQLYLTVFTDQGASVWTWDGDEKDDWQPNWNELQVNPYYPTHITMRYLTKETPHLNATFFDENLKPNGYLTNTQNAQVVRLHDVQGGMSFTYFGDYYYVTYRKTGDLLALVRNTSFQQGNFNGIGITLPPNTYISGNPKIAEFDEKLVIVYASAGTNQLHYIYSSNGTIWSAPQPISLTAKAFAISKFYNVLCITYATTVNPVKTDTYLLDLFDMEM